MKKAIIACMGVVLFAAVAFAEPPATINPLASLPPEIQAKMARLAQILSQAVQSGKLSDAQIQANLSGGDAPAMVRSLGPEAAQLLQEIAAGFKGKYSDDELGMILGGLIGAK